MYGIAITYGVVSLLLLGGFAYITFKRTSKRLAVLMKFAFMSVELFFLCKSHFLQK